MSAVKIIPCAKCGMPCDPREYHPFAACLMFEACHSSESVRANLEAIKQEAARQAMERAAIACEETGKSYDNEWNRNLGVAGDLKDVAEECAEQIRALLPHDTEKRHG